MKKTAGLLIGLILSLGLVCAPITYAFSEVPGHVHESNEDHYENSSSRDFDCCLEHDFSEDVLHTVSFDLQKLSLKDLVFVESYGVNMDAGFQKIFDKNIFEAGDKSPPRLFLGSVIKIE